MKMLELERPDVRVLVHWGHVHADFVKDGAAMDSVVKFASEVFVGDEDYQPGRGSDTANEDELGVNFWRSGRCCQQGAIGGDTVRDRSSGGRSDRLRRLKVGELVPGWCMDMRDPC